MSKPPSFTKQPLSERWPENQVWGWKWLHTRQRVKLWEDQMEAKDQGNWGRVILLGLEARIQGLISDVIRLIQFCLLGMIFLCFGLVGGIFSIPIWCCSAPDHESESCLDRFAYYSMLALRDGAIYFLETLIALFSLPCSVICPEALRALGFHDHWFSFAQKLVPPPS